MIIDAGNRVTKISALIFHGPKANIFKHLLSK